MKVIQSLVISLAFTLTALLAASTAMAKPQQAVVAMGPHEVVQATTDRVMKLINEARSYYDKDPQRFYNEIEKVLADVVDFDSFSRGVMGSYASKQGYMALTTAAEKKAYLARMNRFSEIFRRGLVQTYAKGLLAFNGNKIDVVPAQDGEDVSGDTSVTVQQNIYGDSDKPYVVQYKLRQNRDGQWKLRNVTIEAINLGKVYQGQFKSAARQYNGDIDKVIENWSVDPTKNQQVDSDDVEADEAEEV
jgi:phospholipid transport system substrate-binding protein